MPWPQKRTVGAPVFPLYCAESGGVGNVGLCVVDHAGGGFEGIEKNKQA